MTRRTVSGTATPAGAFVGLVGATVALPAVAWPILTLTNTPPGADRPALSAWIFVATAGAIFGAGLATIAAGRDPSELSVLPCLFAAPGPDRAAGRDAVRRQLFPYVGLPFYRNMLVASGFAEDLERFDAGLTAQDLPLALAGISDAMVDELAATGSSEQIARTLSRFVEAGATLPGVGVASGYEGYEGTKRSLELLREAAVAA